MENKIKLLFITQNEFHTLNPRIIYKQKQKKLKQQHLERIKRLKQDETLKFMSFNYSNFCFMLAPEPKFYFPIIFTQKPEECEIEYDGFNIFIGNNYQLRN
jgi:hypothetical protein